MDGSCEMCVPGLYLDGNSCIANTVTGCLEKKNGLCANCADSNTIIDLDFYNQDGECHRKIEGCSLYASNGLC